MITLGITFALIILPATVFTVYIYNTDDGVAIEVFDCINHESLPYCRRPASPISLERTGEEPTCYNNGTVHSFASLLTTRISIDTILTQWKSSIDHVEQYSRYVKYPMEPNGYLCECTHPQSFGKNCEYLLPMGETFDETLRWELRMRKDYPWEAQMHGDIVCYTTLECNHGILCLDWRDICDGLQQCMSGLDEENCDKLEFNECEQKEYRCANGMCVPDEYFIDGDYDCMDWTDEKELLYDQYCPLEKVSFSCDDRICPLKWWSCGDGQCIFDRLGSQKPPPKTIQCYNRRDSYHMCETHYIDRLWTLPNGRCYEPDKYEELGVDNQSQSQHCAYLLKCTLSRGAEKHCLCGRNNVSCSTHLEIACPDGPIFYPNGALIAPYTFVFYNRSHGRDIYVPDFISLHGTIKCREYMISINAVQRYSTELNQRDIEVSLCQNLSKNSLLSNAGYDKFCHNDSRTFNNHSYHFVDICESSRECISAYRIRDGIRNCLDKKDEVHSEIISKMCTNVKRHRFRCSVDQPTCLGVSNLGNLVSNCRNNYDESWTGTGRMFSTMTCNYKSKVDCQSIRKYVETSWTLNFTNNLSLSDVSARIPYRAYCDTFWNLRSKKDENVTNCREWWICPSNEWQCRTGQCIDEAWVFDGEWDCTDGSDEEGLMVYDQDLLARNYLIVSPSVLAERFNYLHRSLSASDVCNRSTEFPCFRINSTNPYENLAHNRLCISLEQIGDGLVDCYGGIDERNTLESCSPVGMLGYNFRCSSNVTCISYAKLCQSRCPEKLDDAFWCDKKQNTLMCSIVPNSFVCFNGTCLINGRCNGIPECVYAEDEHMCHERAGSSSLYRGGKEFTVINSNKRPYLSRFQNNTNINGVTVMPYTTPTNWTLNQNASFDQLTFLAPYWCNRGVGVKMHNGSIACFCSPHYYGNKCQYHSDRLIVILNLNFSQSGYEEVISQMNALKMLVLFLFQNRTLGTHEFHVWPSLSTNFYNKEFVNFLYSRSPELLRHKRARYFNRSAIIEEQPYSIRVEAYERQRDNRLLLVAVWQYPVYFDYLPVFRLVKVLRFVKIANDRDSCAMKLCSENQQCQRLQNDKSKYICVCKPNYTGENCSLLDQKCIDGYCSSKALCKPDYQVSMSRSGQPYCICPFHEYGQRCEISHDACTSSTCQMGQACFPTSQPDQTVCWIKDQHDEKRTQLTKPGVELHIHGNITYAGAIVQYFDINTVTFDLTLLYQQAFSTLPTTLQYWYKNKNAPFLILVKLYFSSSDIEPHIYFCSLHADAASIYGTVHITDQNRCLHVSTLFRSNNGNSSVCLTTVY